MLETEEIVNNLEKRHKKTYTHEQYNVWAHMINLHKHSSHESAPNKAFFRGTKGAKTKSKDADIPLMPLPLLQLNLHLYLLQRFLQEYLGNMAFFV